LNILRICKLLAFFAIGVVGFFVADAVAVRLALSGFAKAVFSASGLMPAAIVLWFFEGNPRGTIRYLRRPVPWIAWVGRIMGFAIVVSGLLLAVGNLSGQFTTFPYAGSLVIILGATLSALNEVLLANRTTPTNVAAQDE